MGTEEKVIAALRGLPPNRQPEVLNFAECLKARSPSAVQPRLTGMSKDTNIAF